VAQLNCDHPCIVQGHHLHGMQCSVHSKVGIVLICGRQHGCLCSLSSIVCVSWKWFVLLALCLSVRFFLRSYFEVMNGHGIEKKRP
jgi:hypothetical protein